MLEYQHWMQYDINHKKVIERYIQNEKFRNMTFVMFCPS